MAIPPTHTTDALKVPLAPFAPQLRDLIGELDAARARAHRLAGGFPPEDWARRPQPERWSMAEQIVHLSLTSRAFLPLIEGALEEAREQGRFGDGPFRRDFLGWLLGRMIEPPVRLRAKTPAPFIPQAAAPQGAALAEFGRLQDELIEEVRRARGLAVDRVEITSPFDSRVRYSLWSGLRALTAHQRRHLWIGERIRTGFDPAFASTLRQEGRPEGRR
jgi:DinB superfamily